ncbi:hypothetical protein D3C77_537840 [compost metagenome]
MKHQVTAVSYHRIYTAFRLRKRCAESAAHLISHAGKTILHVVRLRLHSSPYPVQVARETSRRAYDDVARIDRLLNDTKRSGLRQPLLMLNGKQAVDFGIPLLLQSRYFSVLVGAAIGLRM